VAITKTKKQLEEEIGQLKQALMESAQGQEYQISMERMKQALNEKEQKIARLEKRIGRVKHAGAKLYSVSEDLERVFENFGSYAGRYNTDGKIRAQIEMLRNELKKARGAYRREK